MNKIDINKPLLAGDLPMNFVCMKQWNPGEPDYIVCTEPGKEQRRFFHPVTGEHVFGSYGVLQNVPEVAPKIDWTKSIELSDGTPAKVVQAGPEGSWFQVEFEGGDRSFRASGKPAFSDSRFPTKVRGRTIRNVAEVPTPAAPALDLTKPLQTRSGRPVALITAEGRGNYPVLGYVGDDTGPTSWTSEGKYQAFTAPRDEDLMNVPPVVTTVYRTVRKRDGDVTLGSVETSDRSRAERLSQGGYGWDGVVAFTLTDGKVTAAGLL